VLTGKYKPGQQVPVGSRATDEKGTGFVQRYLKEDILTRVQQLHPVADAAGLTLAQLAVAWVLQNPNVSSAIIGASRPGQAQCARAWRNRLSSSSSWASGSDTRGAARLMPSALVLAGVVSRPLNTSA